MAFIALELVSKVAGAFMLVHESHHTRWAIGLAMIPRAEAGRVSGVFDDSLYAVMILTIAATTILPPFLLKFFYGRWGHHLPVAEG